MKTKPMSIVSLLLIVASLLVVVPKTTSAIAYVPVTYKEEALYVVAMLRSNERACPVNGETTFRDTWNDRRPGRRHHKGTDMRAERNTPLVAVETGIIERFNYDRKGGGKTIYVKGGRSGAVYFYAHLSSYVDGQEVGDRVFVGDTVGFVGRTGNADVNHLHFGYRPDGSTPENPYSLLQEICTGIDKQTSQPLFRPWAE